MIRASSNVIDPLVGGMVRFIQLGHRDIVTWLILNDGTGRIKSVTHWMSDMGAAPSAGCHSTPRVGKSAIDASTG